MKGKNKLNLGCGYDIRKDFINLDCIASEGVDIMHDLEKYPYPFADNEFKVCLLNHILEHLDNPNKVITELYRITEKNGKIFINVPHFSSWSVWGDITHKRGFNSTSLNHVDIDSKNHASLINKTPVLFKIKKKIIFIGIYKPFGYLININNTTRCLYERYFHGIFPADVINFELTPIKNERKK